MCVICEIVQNVFLQSNYRENICKYRMNMHQWNELYVPYVNVHALCVSLGISKDTCTCIYMHFSKEIILEINTVRVRFIVGLPFHRFRRYFATFRRSVDTVTTLGVAGTSLQAETAWYLGCKIGIFPSILRFLMHPLNGLEIIDCACKETFQVKERCELVLPLWRSLLQ